MKSTVNIPICYWDEHQGMRVPAGTVTVTAAQSRDVMITRAERAIPMQHPNWPRYAPALEVDADGLEILMLDMEDEA